MKIIFALLFGVPLIASVWVLFYVIIMEKREFRRQKALGEAFEAGFYEGEVAFKAGKMCPPGYPLPGRRKHSDNIAREVRAGYIAGWESAACQFENETENIMDAEELEIMLDDLERFANGGYV